MMSKKEVEKGLDDVARDIYYFLKIKLKFDDFQAYSVTFSIFAFPLSLLLGFKGDSFIYFEYLLYFTILLVIVVIVYSVKKQKVRKSIIKNVPLVKSVDVNKITDIEEVDNLSGLDFEKFIGRIYKRKGYKVSYTKRSHDGGADLVVEKGQDSMCVQAKRRSKSVSKQAVYQAYFARKKYSVNRACIATNNELTDQAKNFANDYNIEFIDRFKIMKFLRND